MSTIIMGSPPLLVVVSILGMVVVVVVAEWDSTGVSQKSSSFVSSFWSSTALLFGCSSLEEISSSCIPHSSSDSLPSAMMCSLSRQCTCCFRSLSRLIELHVQFLQGSIYSYRVYSLWSFIFHHDDKSRDLFWTRTRRTEGGLLGVMMGWMVSVKGGPIKEGEMISNDIRGEKPLMSVGSTVKGTTSQPTVLYLKKYLKRRNDPDPRRLRRKQTKSSSSQYSVSRTYSQF
jgi:hypothetical protein